ncbi:MAG: chitobiase/beta-hexosaminidase C-terminal domain-containing protein [Bacteroidota bacterium]
MHQTKAIIRNLVFALQILVLFLLLFEDQVAIPVLLQPLGRMHPLFLHLPIGFLLLLALFPLLQKEVSATAFEKIRSFVLHLAAIAASGTALIGFFLAQEEGYATDLVDWHKWTGIAVSFVTYGLLIWHEKWGNSLKGFNMAVLANTVLLLWAGHLGGSITHGENYVLAPLQEEEKVEITPQTSVFAAAVAPVLEAKCYQCHNEQKTKGELLMTTVEGLLKGGKNGAIWTAGNPDSSHMMQRIHLPLEEKEHMPPRGKSQLSEREIELLHLWIEQGADTKLTLAEVASTNDLFPLVNSLLQEAKEATIEKPKYDFDFADKAVVERLNTPFRNVKTIANDQAALHAEIFVRRAYRREFLDELIAIKEQLTSLNVSNLPIEDADLSIIAQFPNLEKLLLNNTDVSGNNLETLKTCNKLQHLALSGTKVQESHLQKLTDFPALKEVYLWNTDIEPAAIDSLNQQFPNLKFERGYLVNKEEILKLSPPRLKNKNTLIKKGEPIVLESKFPNVTIRYTTDGSEPDSLESLVYTNPIQITSPKTIKTRAFVEGWLGSDTEAFSLFLEGYRPDSAHLLTKANEQYLGKGEATLINLEKGKPGNFRNPAWLGYRDSPLEALIDFGANPPKIVQVVGSFAQNIGSDIFPPKKVEIWGGSTKESLRLLSSTQPDRPEGYKPNIAIITTTLNLPDAQFQYYKIIAHPVSRLPKWHHRKGEKGWVFMDEVFFY